MVSEKQRRARDEFQAHYTSSPHIVSYMVSRLRVTNEDVVWEPAAGVGDLVAGVLGAAPHCRVIASELDHAASSQLSSRFAQQPNVEISVGDTLRFARAPLFCRPESFTRVIANPPYGAWQDPERRNRLKAKYPGLYVKDTYAVFLFEAIERLTSRGRLVFIVPDTFLWLHRHEFLRRRLFESASVEELALFPSKFFPGVHFGYSGLCIISLEKDTPGADHTIRVLRGFRRASTLSALAAGAAEPCSFEEVHIQQLRVLRNRYSELLLPMGRPEDKLWGRQGLTLAQVAIVVTGFYSGNDRRWLRRASERVRGAKHYIPIDPTLLADTKPAETPSIEGINGKRCFVPIVRGGSVSFVKPTQWYVDWGKHAVSEYTRRGRNPARFQNARFYFKQGIAVPMVASTQLTAALLNSRLFDQGIVGIFPRDERLLKFILAFLNTELATDLMRTINPTANNSANYLKRLPFVYPSDDELEGVNLLVDQILCVLADTGVVPAELKRQLEGIISMIWRRATDDLGASELQEAATASSPIIRA